MTKTTISSGFNGLKYGVWESVFPDSMFSNYSLIGNKDPFKNQGKEVKENRLPRCINSVEKQEKWLKIRK